MHLHLLFRCAAPLAGGVDGSGYAVEDIGLFELSSSTWHIRKSQPPLRRVGHSAGYACGTLYLLGGAAAACAPVAAPPAAAPPAADKGGSGISPTFSKATAGTSIRSATAQLNC